MFKGLTNLTIRKKIIFTAILLIFIISAVKIYEYYFIEKLEREVVTNLEKNWKSLQYSRELEAYFYLSTSAISNYAMTGDSKWLDIEKQSETGFKEALKNIKSNPSYPDEFSQTIKNIDTSSTQYFKGVNQTISTNPGALSTYIRNNNGLISRILFQCKELVAYAQRFIDVNNQVLKISFNNTKFFTLITTLLFILMTLAIIFTQSKLLISPISELLNGVKLIWAGDTDHRININTNDEVGELAKVFNLMAESIHREQKRLFEKATTDEMTGLFNFRYFQDVIEKEFEKASRFNHHLSFIILDVDFFKFYNDTNGHQAGDQVLKVVATVVKNSCRDRDIPARYGGEEFVVILPKTPLDAAKKVAERIRKAVENADIIYKERQPNKNLTISLGVSTYPQNAKTVKDLIEFADTALYEAKTSGKNKVCTAKIVK